jgi:hypothetical protein
MICYYKALKLGFINSSSTIALKASGLMAYMYQKRSMTNLVEYYKKIGFSEMFPQYYDYDWKSRTDHLKLYI